MGFLPARDGDLLVRVHRSQVGTPQIEQAVATLQPLLERTTLLDDLAAQRAHLAEQGEVVRDLIYAFSHDLRTPLMANALYMEQALKGAFGPLPDEYCRTLENGLDANDSLLSLADQLLTVARCEGGEAQQEPQEDSGSPERTLRSGRLHPRTTRHWPASRNTSGDSRSP